MSIKGHLDRTSPGWACGWAWDEERPSKFLTIILYLNGKEITRTSANLLRLDLAEAGMGEGRCAFSVTWDQLDLPPGDYQLSARVENSDVELIDSPLPYRIGSGTNLLGDVTYASDLNGLPLSLTMTEAELDKLGFEALSSSESSLRIWTVFTSAATSEHPDDGSLPEGTEVILLRRNVSCKGALDFKPIKAGLDIRSVSQSASLTLIVSATYDDSEVVSHRYPIAATAAWNTALFDVELPTTQPVPQDWTFELAIKTPRVMEGVEVRNLVLGAPQKRMALASESSKAASYFESLPGRFAQSNLLSSTDLVASSTHASLSPRWEIVRGRNGDLGMTMGSEPWSPVNDSRLQSRRLSRFEISSNAHYFRFVHPLHGTNITQCKELASELVFGAQAAAGAKSGIAIKSFMRVLDASGAEVILPLLPKQEVEAELASRISTSSLTPEQITMLTQSKSVQYAVEITGTGTLLIGPNWLGDADLVAAKPERVSASSDTTARNWHYSRYLETVESLFLPLPTEQDLAACVVAPQHCPVELRNQAVAATVRSLIKHAAKILVILSPTSEENPGVVAEMQQHLLEVVSLREMAKVAVRTFVSDEEAKFLFSGFVEELAPDCLVVTFVAGSLVRTDFVHALSVAAQDKKTSDFIVFDHDTLDALGSRTNAVIKPGLSRHLLLETDYIGSAVAIRAAALQRAITEGAISPVLPFGTRDVLLHLFDWSGIGTKLDAVLLHLPPGADDKTIEAEHRFIEKVVSRSGSVAVIDRWGSEFSVKYRPPQRPLVSIIVLFRDKVDYLRRCVESLRTRTSYNNYELILVNNRSQELETISYLSQLSTDVRFKIVEFDRSFNYSMANNLGARNASGDYLVFLNNDTEILSPDWLEVMVGLAALERTGFVGPRLHFENGAVQHAGIVIGLKGLANHAFIGEQDVAMPKTLLLHTRDVSAVTGAAMCINAAKFWELGGFDERFVLTGNDVEICLRARRRGLSNILAGSVQLFHFEKSSRKDIPVFLRDIQLSLETYEPELSSGDPFWNSILSRTRTDYLPRGPVEPSPAVERKAATEKRANDMRSRKLGPDTNFIIYNDVDQATIDRNHKINQDYLRGEAGVIRRAAYFVPPLAHIYRGGLFTCFRFAAALFRSEGILPLVVVCSDRPVDLHILRKQFAEAFPGVPFEFFHFDVVCQSPISIPYADIAVATLWTTAYIVARYPAKGKFYLIQDYEPLFEAAGAGYGLIEASYRFGFFPICNSPGVAAAISPYGNIPTLSFKPAVDRSTFFPAVRAKPATAPIRVVFYGRPNNPRNLFGLGMHALLELKSILRDSIEIVSVGATFDPGDYGAEGSIHNVGLLPSIESVAELYRSCDIGLVFMQSKHPSYQPLEYMASGCATVTNVNEANSWLLEHRVNCLLSQVTLTAVVDSLLELVQDVELRRSIQARGLASVTTEDWSTIERRVTSFIMKPPVAQRTARRVRK